MAVSNVGLGLSSPVATGGVAHIIDTIDEFLTGTLLSIRTDGNEVVSVGFDGSIVSTGNITVDPTKRIYLDGGVDTYIYETGDNNIAFVGGAALGLTVSGVSISIPANHKLYFDGGDDTYIEETSDDVLQIVAGATNALIFTPAVVTVLTSALFDLSAVADFTRLQVWDVTAGAYKRVRRGAADSGGSGSRALIIDN